MDMKNLSTVSSVQGCKLAVGKVAMTAKHLGPGGVVEVAAPAFPEAPILRDVRQLRVADFADQRQSGLHRVGILLRSCGHAGRCEQVAWHMVRQSISSRVQRRDQHGGAGAAAPCLVHEDVGEQREVQLRQGAAVERPPHRTQHLRHRAAHRSTVQNSANLSTTLFKRCPAQPVPQRTP